MAEVREVHEIEAPVEPRRGSFILPIIMFVLGGALIAAVVVAVLDARGTIAWPAGQVSLGPNSAVAESGTTPVAPPVTTTASAPAVIAPSTTENTLPTVDTTPPPEATTPPAATDDSETQPSPPPADTTTPPE